MKPNGGTSVLSPKEFSMKAILLLMLIVGAAVCSIAGPNSSSWDDWRYESRMARQEARRAREEGRREARQAIEHARRTAREAHRQAFESRIEMRREEQQFLREMRQRRLEVEREVREAFRAR
jgi:hypothetical protein